MFKIGIAKSDILIVGNTNCLSCNNKISYSWNLFCNDCLDVMSTFPMTDQQFIDLFKGKDIKIIEGEFIKAVLYNKIFYAFPPVNRMYTGIIGKDGKIIRG